MAACQVPLIASFDWIRLCLPTRLFSSLRVAIILNQWRDGGTLIKALTRAGAAQRGLWIIDWRWKWNMSTVLLSPLRCDVLRCVVVCRCRCSGAEYQEIFRATQVSGAPKESRNVVFFSSPSPKRKKKKCRNFKMWLRLLAVLTVTGCFINPSAYLLETNYIKKKKKKIRRQNPTRWKHFAEL